MNTYTKKWITAGGAFAAFLTGTALSHADSYEYQTTEGYHEEEWYDPSDWFDDGQWGYDSQTVDFENDATGDWAFWDNDAFWEDDYDYDYDSSESDYGSYYSWNDESNSWERNYGSNETTYDYDPASYMIVYSTSSNDDRSWSSEKNKDRNWQQRNKSQSKKSKAFNQRTLKGEIEGFRHMSLKAKGDSNREYTVTKVALDSGKKIVINLGEKSRLDSLNLENGDDVKVKGTLGKLNGEPLFIANKVMVDGRTFDVNRAFDNINKMDRQNERSQNQSYSSSAYQQNRSSGGYESSENNSDNTTYAHGNNDRSSDRSGVSPYQQNRDSSALDFAESTSDQVLRSQGKSDVQGTVEAFRSTRIPGTSEDRTLARLRLESGKAITVDLGENSSVRGLDLSQGDEVRIKGDMKRVEGRSILKADRIWINGDTVQSFSYNY